MWERLEAVGALPSAPSGRLGPTTLVVAVEPFDAPDSRWLVARAEAELDERYGPGADPHSVLTASEFDPPAGCFVVARTRRGGGPGGRRRDAAAHPGYR